MFPTLCESHTFNSWLQGEIQYLKSEHQEKKNSQLMFVLFLHAAQLIKGTVIISGKELAILPSNLLGTHKILAFAFLQAWWPAKQDYRSPFSFNLQGVAWQIYWAPNLNSASCGSSPSLETANFLPTSAPVPLTAVWSACISRQNTGSPADSSKAGHAIFLVRCHPSQYSVFYPTHPLKYVTDNNYKNAQAQGWKLSEHLGAWETIMAFSVLCLAAISKWEKKLRLPKTIFPLCQVHYLPMYLCDFLTELEISRFSRLDIISYCNNTLGNNDLN